MQVVIKNRKQHSGTTVLAIAAAKPVLNGFLFKTTIMEKNNNQFQEQDAPQKNTDNAFVQVGEDGKPQVPEKETTSTASTQQPSEKGSAKED